VIAVAEGPVADNRDRLRIWAITASIRGQKTRDGTLFGVLRGGLTLLHPQNYQVTKYYTRRRIWDDNTQKWYSEIGYKTLGWSKVSQDRYLQ
jgi:hypothetical protein